MLDLRAVAYAPGGGRVGVLPDALELTLTVPRADTPTVDMTYPPGLLGVRGGLLDREVEVAVEYTTDGTTWVEPPGARFLSQQVESDVLADGTASRRLRAIHVSNRLTGALVWDVPAAAADSDGKYSFLSATAGTVLRTLWDAAAARGWGGDLSLDCTPGQDSAGRSWSLVHTIAYDRGVTLAQVLQSLVSLGLCDVQWQGRTMRVYNADTALARHLPPGTVWRLGAGTTSAPETTTWSELCTDVLVKGEGGYTLGIHNAAAPAGTRRTERTVEAGGVTTEATARLVAQAALASGAQPAQEVKREWDAADPYTLLPWRDYRPGDWMRVERATGADELRVAQVSVTRSASGTSGHTTFGTRLDDTLARIARRTKGITGGASLGGSGSRPAPTVDHRQPAAPRGLVARGVTVPAQGGYYHGVVQAQWAAVTTDVRGAAITVSGYETQVADARTPGLWRPVVATSSTSVNVPDLEPGESYLVQVRAVSSDGVPGPWSPSAPPVLVPTDTEPPPVPSTPLPGQTLGVLQVTWDGATADGGSMPEDLHHLEVAVTLPGTPPAPGAPLTRMDPASRTVVVADLEAREWQVVLRAVDTVGNASPWSAPARVTLSQTVDPDAIRRQVDERIRSSKEIERTARAQALAALVAAGRAAGGDVLTTDYPPDAGTVGSTLWVAPDGRVFRLTQAGR